MAAFAGLLNRQMTPAQALTGQGAGSTAAPLASSSSSGSSSSSSATISSNDFLTLLVTEMQNQDPTADTDPNEYINQLVQINSLEQLISINQNLTTALGTAPSTSTSGSISGPISSKDATGSAPGLSPGSLSPGSPSPSTGTQTASAVSKGGSAVPAGTRTAAAHGAAPSGTAAAINQFVKSSRAMHAPGNLSVPEAKSSARRVAHALDGQPRSPGVPARIPHSN